LSFTFSTLEFSQKTRI